MKTDEEEFCAALLSEAKRHGVAVTADARDALSLHYGMLRKWNPRVRLVGSVEPRRAAVELFADSLVAARFAQALVAARAAARADISAVDIGSGGGFPGIIVKIVYPQWRITLIDSSTKKIAFLKAAVREAGIEKIDVIRGRAEDLSQRPEMTESFDLAFCRAVTQPAAACALALPFVKIGGFFIAQTGALAREAKDEKNKTKGNRPKNTEFRVPSFESRVEKGREDKETEGLLRSGLRPFASNDGLGGSSTSAMDAFREVAEALGAKIEVTHTYRLTGLAGERRLIGVRKVSPTQERAPGHGRSQKRKSDVKSRETRE
ncbi:MAG: 16S rRNA (guanine(527)-N(7))-methyltransferase RsmG [Candidatus Lindowbacteria bacterium]|nr:16S rRNA (guanine(527)-N(7))-methyltransferase RsmG [Candidatus Lindowbacteria bacterium]